MDTTNTPQKKKTTWHSFEFKIVFCRLEKRASVFKIQWRHLPIRVWTINTMLMLKTEAGGSTLCSIRLTFIPQVLCCGLFLQVPAIVLGSRWQAGNAGSLVSLYPQQPIPALPALHVVSGLLCFAPCYFVPSHILYVMYYLFLCLLMSASPPGIQASRKQGFLCWLPCSILGAQSRAPPVMTVHGRMNAHSGFIDEVIKNQRILPKVTQNFKRRSCPLNQVWGLSGLCTEPHCFQHRGYVFI